MNQGIFVRVLSFAVICVLCANRIFAQHATIQIDTPMPPPTWALLERELLQANAQACQEFFEQYFDQRGYLLCVERWGGDDGPDDAIENCNDWPILHALGASDSVLEMYKKAWEGHLRQFTEAKTELVPFARDGMYYKEFPVMFDWLHNGEGLTVFNLQGLSDPNDRKFRQRVCRYAGFYMNEDPGAPNYDPRHKIIRSMFNGSRGPLLRKATAVDWAGDPVEVQNRFRLGHGEENYEQMLAHFEEYTDIVGDHPQNLLATTLALNAYMLEHDPKYRRWLLEYVDAWLDRMAANGNIIPTNIGWDGAIGGETDGKWYGGVYGWAFSVTVPQDGSVAHRNQHGLGVVGFLNAFLLTGDDRYLDGWRKQIDTVNEQKKVVDGRTLYPRMCGEHGWYHFVPAKYSEGALEIYYSSMKPSDRRRVPGNAWLDYLEGHDPDYPQRVLLHDFARLRDRVHQMRQNPTTPDTRLSDDPMKYNPASVTSLIHLMLGGLHPGHRGAVLRSALRYFNPVERRAGIPNDIGALVETLTGDEVTVVLVNVSQLEPKTVDVQAGSYGQHQFVSATVGETTVPIDSALLTVRLAPGAGGRLRLKMNRYANQPTMLFPWDR